MGTWTGHKIKSCAHTAIFQLLKAGLRAQVLGVGRIGRNPLQKPLVTFVFAGDLQGYHEVSSECHHAELTSLTQEGKPCTYPHQTKPGSKVRIVLQRSYKISQRHDSL